MTTPRYAKAVALATSAHYGVFRTGTTVPYISHPLAVSAMAMEYGGSEDVAIAAVLHDVIEDCDVSPQDLTAHGFSPDIVQTVMLLSKNIETPAGGYLERIAADPIARAVKVSEVADNSSHKRQARLAEQGVEFNLDKYPEALRQLSLTPAEEEWFESVR